LSVLYVHSVPFTLFAICNVLSVVQDDVNALTLSHPMLGVKPCTLNVFLLGNEALAVALYMHGNH
jgi:hypothetical protein